MTTPTEKKTDWRVFEGLAPDIDNDVYHSFEKTGAYSSSQLKKILDDPEIFYKTYISKEIPKEENSAFDIGTYFHTSILEPHKVATECMVYNGIRRGAEWEAFKAKNKGKVIINPKEYVDVQTLCKGIHESPIAMDLLKGITAEESCFVTLHIGGDGNIYHRQSNGQVRKLTTDGWSPSFAILTDETLYPLRFKVRADGRKPNVILDLKSTSGNCRDAKDVIKKIEQLDYDLSAAFYIDLFTLFAKEGEAPYEFYWLFSSKSAPMAQSYVASEETIKIGRAKYAQAIRLIAKNELNGWKFQDTLVRAKPSTYSISDWGNPTITTLFDEIKKYEETIKSANVADEL